MKFTPAKKRKRVYLILQTLELMNINIDTDYIEKIPLSIDITFWYKHAEILINCIKIKK